MKKKGLSSFSSSCLCALGGDGSLVSRAEGASLAPLGLWFCAGEEMVPRRLSRVTQKNMSGKALEK